MPGAFGTASESELRQAAAKEKGTAGRNLIAQVTTTKSYVHGAGKFKVVAFDFGIKTTILNCLAEFATVHVVPASHRQRFASYSAQGYRCSAFALVIS